MEKETKGSKRPEIDFSEEPDIDTLWGWMDEGGCETPDGCWVEPDGKCEHGYPSWMRLMGLI